MRISSRPLNKGETLCCSIRRAKDFFKDTDVELSLVTGAEILLCWRERMFGIIVIKQ